MPTDNDVVDTVKLKPEAGFVKSHAGEAPPWLRYIRASKATQ